MLAETDEVDNPTFLSVTRGRQRIYANSEVFAWREGTVTALRFDRRGRRARLCQQAAGPRQHHRPQRRDPRRLASSWSPTTAWERAARTSPLVVFGIRDGRRTDGAARQRRAHGRTGPNARAPGARATPTASPRPSAVASPSSPTSASTASSTYRIGDDGASTRSRAHGPGARRRTAPCRDASRRPVRVRHERARFDRGVASLDPDDRRAARDRHEAGRPGRGARRQPLRRHPDLARRALPLRLEPRP